MAGNRVMMAGLIGAKGRAGKVRIGVAGAGVGGLAAAVMLARAGHDVTLIDQFDRPRPVGSGLVMQPVGLMVLDQMGLGRAARRMGAPLLRLQGDTTTGRQVLDVAYARHTGLGLHRAALFDMLWQAAQVSGIRFVTDAPVTGQDRAHIVCRAGRLGSFDLIVDAAGAASPLSPLVARPLPYGAIWGTVDWPNGTGLPTDRLSQRYHAASRMAGVLPVGRLPGDPVPKAAVFWSLPVDRLTDWAQAGLDAWKDEVAAHWPAMAPFLVQITDPAQMTPARYSHGRLRRPFGPGIVHIGDAAHRASPQLGQGANMALLDALALARALELADGQDAGHIYAQARAAHVALYQTLSALFTPQYQSGSSALPVLRDHILAPLSRSAILRPILSRLIEGSLLPPLASLDRRAPGKAGGRVPPPP